MKKTTITILISIIIVVFFIALNKNEEITNYPSNGTDIVAIGDSLVKGVGASSEDKNFVSLLSQKINGPIINLGVSGNTTSDVLKRIDELDQFNPKVVILLAGGNDRIRRIEKTETFNNLEKIIQNIQSRGAIVLLLGIKGSIVGDRYADEFERLQETYKTAYVEDVLDGLFGNSKFMSDGIHPNDVGYNMIAEKIYPILDPLTN